MTDQNQERDDVQENNLGLEVAIDISLSEYLWPRKILTPWCQGEKTLVYG